MIKLSTRIATIFILSIFLTSFSQVYSQGNQQMERFKEEKITFFNDKLDLSDKEKEIFWPLYDDHFNRIMKINEDERTLLSYYKSNAEHLSDEEVDETIEKHFNIQQQRFDLELQFHDKFVEAVGKKKTMTMYTLEREFRMHVLRKFRGGEGSGHPGQGRPRGGGNR